MSDQALKKIEAKLDQLATRIAKVEAKLNVAPPVSAPPQQTVSPTISTPAIAAAATSTPESNRGSWLAWSGILFFILAACYFVKLTIDSGWLTPERQFAGIVLFGVGLIYTGLKLHAQEKSFAAMIAGAGVVVFYVAAFSGHRNFHLYDAWTATLLTGGVSAVSVWLFRTFTHDFFLIAAAVGSYTLPFLIGPHPHDLHQLASYFIFWDVVFVAFALMLNRRLLIALISYLAIFNFYVLWADHTTEARNITTPFVLYFQLFQFLLMTTAVFAFSVRNKVALTAKEAWSFFPILVIFYAAQYGNIDRLYPGQAPRIALLFAALICGVYWLAVRMLHKTELPSGPVVSAFTALVLYHTIYLELLPDQWSAWLAIALLFLPLIAPKSNLASRHWVALLFPRLIVFAEYMQAMFDDKLPYINLAFFGALLLHNLIKSSALRSSFFILALAISQGMRGIYLLVETHVGAPMNQLVTSGCWASLAMLVLLIGYSRHDERTAKAGVILFGFIAGKVLCNDLDTTDSIVRVISLVAIGALLYAGGIFWKKIGNFEKSKTV